MATLLTVKYNKECGGSILQTDNSGINVGLVITHLVTVFRTYS